MPTTQQLQAPLGCAHIPSSSTSAEVPGGDGPGSVSQTALLSRGAPRANVRTFLPVAQGRMHAVHQHLPFALLAPLCGEEGLRSVEGQTFDHSRSQRRGKGTVRKDSRHDTAQQRCPHLDTSPLGVEPLAVGTLQMVVALVSKNMVFFDQAQHIFWH